MKSNGSAKRAKQDNPLEVSLPVENAMIAQQRNSKNNSENIGSPQQAQESIHQVKRKQNKNIVKKAMFTHCLFPVKNFLMIIILQCILLQPSRKSDVNFEQEILDLEEKLRKVEKKKEKYKKIAEEYKELNVSLQKKLNSRNSESNYN